MTARERVARQWHAGSDHAADGAGFGSPTCNCWRVADRMMPLLAEAWADAIGEAYDRGWIHDYGRDEMIDRSPYRHEGAPHVDH